jgi:hypothetical protein
LARRAAAAATSLTAAGLLFGATPALAAGGSATPAGTTTHAKVAVISPLLSIFSVGATLGLPEVCITGSGAMLSIANSIPGATAPVANFASKFTSQCSAMGVQGGLYLAQFNDSLAPLTAINPAFNPYIEQFATAVEGFGNSYGTALAPLGPTIVGFGGDIRFFEGS